ncbi:MAG: ABC transporter ATP-binding protein [Gammaproteobacteria bacterium]|nr:ABC transporter ATP-binding protein [Gammaproteobacteria bacterium]
MARIELKGVQKSWGNFVGVNDVDLDIADEELIVLLGPSGCGKTTTMRMIAGLEEPTAGSILMDGEEMNDIDARDRDVAMVFQGYALYPNMNVYENIRFPLRMRGVARNEQDALIREAAAMVEMEDYLHRKPSALSGGQRQRAALARAVVRSPQVFLMDEPLSNLDAKLRQSMRIQIKQLQRKLKITTVYVTHDQIEAMTLADRIVVMHEGSCQQIGTPDQIYSDPANTFVAAFIGSPPMNLIAGTIENHTFRAEGITVSNIQTDLSGPVQLGIRPEDTSVADDPSSAHVNGTVYGVEPTGDMTFLTLLVDQQTLEIKADRDYRSDLGQSEHINFDLDRLYFFDAQTGERLR